MNEQGKDYEAFVAANKTGDWFNFKAGESYGREEYMNRVEHFLRDERLIILEKLYLEQKLEIEYMKDRVNFLDSLIEHGVDNWSGYGEAYKEYKLNKALGAE